MTKKTMKKFSKVCLCESIRYFVKGYYIPELLKYEMSNNNKVNNIYKYAIIYFIFF